MATLTKGYTFGATEQVTAAKLHSLVDSATLASLVAADISDGVITNAKMSDVAGAKFTGLTTVPAGAGVIPKENLTSVAQKGANSDITSLSGLTTALSTAQGGTGSTANANAAGGVVVPTGAVNAANGAVVLDGSSKLPAVDGSQLTNVGGGHKVYITGSGTWTAPTTTTVLVTLVGGGGGGGGGNQDSNGGGGGGGAGATIYRRPYSVTASTGYSYSVGAAGTAGPYQTSGGNGGDTTFDTLTAENGHGGGGAGGNVNGGAGSSGTGTITSFAITAASGTTAGKGVINNTFSGGAAAAGSVTSGGGGGASVFGSGGAGGQNNGTGYGSGGGGGPQGTGAGAAGGAGTGGIIIIEY
jgi:hypothetical protein